MDFMRGSVNCSSPDVKGIRDLRTERFRALIHGLVVREDDDTFAMKGFAELDGQCQMESIERFLTAVVIEIRFIP
jgi:hypothetical protein